MHRLQGVNNVELVMVRVVLEVTIGYFRSKVDETIHRKVEMIVEVVHVTDLKHQVLNGIAWQ